MATSASVKKPVENSHADQPNQGQKEMLQSLVEVVSHLSGNECIRSLKGVFDEESRLRSRIQELEGKFEGEKHIWDTTSKKIFEEVAKVRADTEQVKRASDEKEKQLQDARKNEKKAKEKLTEYEKELKGLRAKVTADETVISDNAQKFKDQEKELSDLNVKLKDQKQVLERSSQEAKRTQGNLAMEITKHESTRQELAELKGLAAPLGKPVGTPALIANREQFGHLLNGVCKLVDDHFGQLQIHNGIFESSAWRYFTTDRRLAGIPLPPTNSPVAKRMRVTAVLRVIALAVVDHLFQPVYLTGEGLELGHVLHHIYALDRSRAQLVRSVLLSIDQKVQTGNGKKREEAVIRDVLDSVGFLFPEGSPKKKNDFRTAIQEWCIKARGFWMELQQLEERFTVIFEGENKNLRVGNWGKRLPDNLVLPTQGGAPAKTNGSKRQDGLLPKPVVDDIVTQVWPAFCVQQVANKELQGLHVFTRGYLLYKSQIAAAHEEVDAYSRERENESYSQGGDIQNSLPIMALGEGVNSSVENITFLSAGG